MRRWERLGNQNNLMPWAVFFQLKIAIRYGVEKLPGPEGLKASDEFVAVESPKIPEVQQGSAGARRTFHSKINLVARFQQDSDNADPSSQ